MFKLENEVWKILLFHIFSFRFEKNLLDLGKNYIRVKIIHLRFIFFISPESSLCLLFLDQIFLSSSSSHRRAGATSLPVPHRYDRRIPIYRKKRCVPRAKTRSIVAGIILGWRTIARKCSKGRLNSAGGDGKWWKQWRGVSRGEGKSLWISLRLNRHFEAKYLWDENAWNASSGRQATRFSRRRIVN